MEAKPTHAYLEQCNLAAQTYTCVMHVSVGCSACQHQCHESYISEESCFQSRHAGVATYRLSPA